jgi:hypothetical protein
MQKYNDTFDKLFETAEIAKFTPDQIRSYEDSLKYYRDIKASLDTKFEDGKIEIDKNLTTKSFGFSNIVEL